MYRTIVLRKARKRGRIYNYTRELIRKRIEERIRGQIDKATHEARLWLKGLRY